jgi:mercuric ion transport protein
MLASIRAVLRREMTRRNKVGALLAILTCPCHVVMILFLLAGTALGTWLAAIRAWLFLGFTLLFLGGLWLMFRPDSTTCDPCDTGASRSE